MIHAGDIKRIAREEVEQERLRAAIEEEESRLRAYRSLWDRLFPFTIIIRRKA